MNIAELSKHHSIGIDFDGTLVEHPRSHILQQFILDHHLIKSFHIITFRSHGMEDRIAKDLAASTFKTMVPLALDHFAGIHSIPYHLHENHAELKQNDGYYGWKAEKCREIGCTVLIDDMEPTIGEYCRLIEIMCLNPDHY